LAGVSDFDFTTKTGFENFDYLNGQLILRDDGTKQLYTGLSNGRIVQIIGKSGSGKSTMAAQMATNIIKRYDNGLLYYYDFEKGTDKSRIRMVSGMSENEFEERVTILKTDISTEKVLRMLYTIKTFKEQHRKELLVPNENGIKDKAGNIVQVMTPTVVVVDSLSAMMPEGNFDEGNIEGQMSQTQNAKINAQFFRKATQVCDSANIILIIVNHITENISIGVTPVSAQINYLKNTEAIPGGTVAKFMTDTLIKITTSTKLEEDKLWGIKGFEAKIEICKSRHAPAGRSVTMIYDQVNGFRNDLSMLDYIKSCGALKGNGMAYYIDGHDEYKFRLSNFSEKFETIPEFNKIVTETAQTLLKASIKETKNIPETTEDIEEVE
jgi:RecA/RadA recombinase